MARSGLFAALQPARRGRGGRTHTRTRTHGGHGGSSHGGHGGGTHTRTRTHG